MQHGKKMSKSQGNVIDPLAAHRPVRRRRAPLHFGRAGGAGPAPAAPRRRPGAGRAELRHQALERRALCRDKRLPTRTTGRPQQPIEPRQTVNRWIIGETVRTAAAVDRALAALRFNEAAGRALRPCLEGLLRLVCRAGKASAPGRGRRARKPRPGRRWPGRSTAAWYANAPDHALRHRGALGCNLRPVRSR